LRSRAIGENVRRVIPALHTFGAAMTLVALVTLPAVAQDLSSQATDPTASLMSMSVLGEATTSYWDRDDSGFTLKFQPAVPFKAWGTANIVRVVVPYQTAGPGDEGLKSASILHVVIVPQKWGRLAVGSAMSLAESTGSAESKFAIGPAVGGVHSASTRLTVGLFSQACLRATRPSHSCSRLLPTSSGVVGRLAPAIFSSPTIGNAVNGC